ncbi:MAG: ADP-ribosylglycohydrolase family protein, partial [Lachnospiraceae bacterium]
MKEYWLDGIMGVLTGDALGDPVQFESREEVACHPVTGMRGGGAYAMPAGTWTDDSSMTLATLTSISK